MASDVTLEQLEALAAQLSPSDQLRLAARICEQLSEVPPAPPPDVGEVEARWQREKEADELLALIDAAAAMWDGEFDSAEEIRRMRAERDERLWPKKQ